MQFLVRDFSINFLLEMRIVCTIPNELSFPSNQVEYYYSFFMQLHFHTRFMGIINVDYVRVSPYHPKNWKILATHCCRRCQVMNVPYITDKIYELCTLWNALQYSIH